MKSCNLPWTYVLISLVYFLLIGVVILVLLLAPKYPSFTEDRWYLTDIAKKPTEYDLEQPLPNSYGIPGAPVVVVATQPKKPIIIPSRRDPVYDIDPRSNLENDFSPTFLLSVNSSTREQD
ncbi:unnamed protein product [Allacma fusca]|uniref:Uncharacterized protein n=1 Tax=Allacma fusca TaxID=39272 RepID=A0A8J2PY55_9HEXA|nr:unnamed protein product [Allacma fusca]